MSDERNRNGSRLKIDGNRERTNRGFAASADLASKPGGDDCARAIVWHIPVVQREQRGRRFEASVGAEHLRYWATDECCAAWVYFRDLGLCAERLGGPFHSQPDFCLLRGARSGIQCLLCLVLARIVERGRFPISGGIVPGRNLSDWDEACGQLVTRAHRFGAGVLGGHADARDCAAARNPIARSALELAGSDSNFIGIGGFGRRDDLFIRRRTALGAARKGSAKRWGGISRAF